MFVKQQNDILVNLDFIRRIINCSSDYDDGTNSKYIKSEIRGYYEDGRYVLFAEYKDPRDAKYAMDELTNAMSNNWNYFSFPIDMTE